MKSIYKTGLTLAGLALLFLLIGWANGHLNEYYNRVLNTAAIYIVAAVSYNLINGVAGQFSLGPNGFMAIGAYVTTLLILPVSQKQAVWFLQPLVWPLRAYSLPLWLFPVALLAGGTFAALGAFLIGIPALRLRGDYLAIATFGFGEIIFVLANNIIPLTNGPLGIKGIPNLPYLLWVTWGCAVLAVLAVTSLVNSSFGRALKAIREDEVAAEAMGVALFRHKMLALVVSGFFGGISGGLLAFLVSTISPSAFTFFMTFTLLIIIVLGGLGSTTGAVVTAVIYTVLQELLRVVESPLDLGPVHIPGISGMRMVVISALLIAVMLFYRRGLFGGREFSWDWLWQKWTKRKGTSWNQTAASRS